LTVETIRSGGDPRKLSKTDELVLRLGRGIFTQRRVDDELYKELIGEFGASALVNLVALMGNYAATAAALCTFGMRLDEGVEAPF
jgi:4-carboxymuconolactone decarboxylase